MTKTKRKVHRRKNKGVTFAQGFKIYVSILAFLGLVFLLYSYWCLEQYDLSQPEQAMSKFVVEFEKMVKDGSVKKYISVPEESELESNDIYYEMFMKKIGSENIFYFEKDSASYLSDQPLYDINDGSKTIAKMKLKAVNERRILGILTIMDWEIDHIEPVLEFETKNYTINVPKDYSVIVNGYKLDDAYLTGQAVEDNSLENLKEYVELPKMVEYRVSNLVNQPDITVEDSNGNPVETTKDEAGNVSVKNSYEAGEIPEDRQETAYKIAKMWEDFVTNDLEGASHGLAEIQKYLIKDSYYYNLAAEYAAGPDIGLVSEHIMADPAYSDLKIDNYVQYTDNSFSCHVYFVKRMLLTDAHNKLREEIVDSTFYFVKYDDSDDGDDNPHWCMVDMVAATE